jgi:membrane-bound lytic murein transglycosylase D
MLATINSFCHFPWSQCLVSTRCILLQVFFLLVFPVFISAQVLQDTLENSLLAEFSTDPEHHQFHREQGPLDSLFMSYVPAVDPELVEDRVSCLDLKIPLVVNKTVCSFIHYFTVRKRNYTQTMLERKNYYFPIFEYYLRKYEMPDALKYLAIVESGLNYRAKSKAGALGLWQFMPGTGRDFRLDQSHHSDQRQNPWLATEAACKFLKSLYGTFQDWELALAAYNCGPGNVLKAQRRSGKKGFWDIYSFLPQETRSYVPQFHAVVYSMNYAREHNIMPDIDSVLTVIPLDTFRINRACDLRKLETMLGMDPKALQHHNPDLRSNYFPGGTLLVPGSHGSLLAANLEIYLDSARYIAPVHQVAKVRQEGVFIRKGTSVTQFTSRRGWDKMAFCKLNGIKGDKIRRSRYYQMPENLQNTESFASSDSSIEKNKKFSGKSLQGNKEKLIVKEASAERQEAISLPEFHMVVKGEGLFSVARKYGLEVVKLRSLNPGTGDKLWNGQQIRLRDDAFDDSDSANGKKEVGVIHPVAGSKVSAQSIRQTPSEGTPILYEVQKGDTLYSITRKFNRLSVKELIRINNLKNRQIKPGQQLIVG